MRRRHPLPRLWMMTDERQGPQLLPSINLLPSGSGIVFRHYSLLEKERRRLFDQVRRLTDAKRIMLLLSGPPSLAANWGADGSHGLQESTASKTSLTRSASAHTVTEVLQAEKAGADLVFVSPVFPTRSHPNSRALGLEGLTELARHATMPVIALGGMTEERARRISAAGAYGWAAIDALTLKAD